MRKRSVWNRRIGASCALVLCLLVAPATNVWAAPPTEDGTPGNSQGQGNSDEAHAKNEEKKGGSSEETTAATSAALVGSNQGGGPAVTGTVTTPTGSECPNKHAEGENTGNGANTSGAYDSTCNGSPSLNGNGNGGAGGKPCAGCVGNADNKNPKGQAPNGSDHNNGYECDGNNGVGKSNPAHTGCTTPPPCTQNCNPCTVNCNPCTVNCNPCTVDCNPCTVNCNPCTVNCNPCVGDDCNPPGDEVCPAGTDNAGTPVDEVESCNEDDVLPRVITKNPPEDRVLGKRLSVLPFTGGNAANFVTWALLMITAGALLLLPSAVTRRREMSHQK